MRRVIGVKGINRETLLTIFWVKTNPQRRDLAKHGHHNLNQAEQVTLRLSINPQTNRKL